MARLVAAKCPNCGAALRLDPSAQWVTCSYCSTSSFIQLQGRPAPPVPPPGPLIFVEAPRAPNPALFVIPVVAAVMLCGAGFGIFSLMGASARSTTATQTTGTPGKTPAGTTARKVSESIASRRPLLADVDGDRVEDVLVMTTAYVEGAWRSYFSAYDGRTGTKRWQTPELGKSAYQLRNAVLSGTLLVADDAAKLTAYRVTSGEKLWTMAIGDKLERYCLPPHEGRVRLRIQDESQIDVELATGTRFIVAGKPDCKPASADERPRELGHPRGWKSEVMPEQLESYGCGSTRFMGDYNFVLEDRCGPRLKVDSERLASFRPGSIARYMNGFLIVGHKSPGSRIPMVGFARPGNLVWSSVLPASEPLEFGEGAPNKLAISGDVVVLAYEYRSGSKSRATAFDIATGKRFWDVELPPPLGRPDQIVASATAAFVCGNSALVALALGDGKKQFSIGRD
jgi:hypothetical protein